MRRGLTWLVLLSAAIVGVALTTGTSVLAQSPAHFSGLINDYGPDFLTGYEAWLNCQNGAKPAGKITYDPTPRYIRSGRDLGERVHQHFPYNASLNALLILLGIKTTVDAGNPYLNSATQAGLRHVRTTALLQRNLNNGVQHLGKEDRMSNGQWQRTENVKVVLVI
jgi:hypothetical protein